MNMSDSGELLYDAHGRWRRWEPAPLTTGPTPLNEPSASQGNDSPDPSAASQPMDPEAHLAEMNRLREAARAEGHAEGYAAGHDKGHETGWQVGHEAGRVAGFEAGMAEGYTEGAQAARTEVEQLDTLMHATTIALERLEAETGQALISLAVSIARQVLYNTLESEPERILDAVREVLQVEGSQQGLLKLRVHPADLGLVEQYLQHDDTVARWQLLADTDIARGGCKAETALGEIDATLQTRWRRVVSALGVTP